MERRYFIKNLGSLGIGLVIDKSSVFDKIGTEQIKKTVYPIVRTPRSKRNFKSEAVENVIQSFKKSVKNKEYVWLFENCFPNTLVRYFIARNTEILKPMYSGDIDDIWLRDNSAQVYPYLEFINKDAYANAFYNEEKEDTILEYFIRRTFMENLQRKAIPDKLKTQSKI